MSNEPVFLEMLGALTSSCLTQLVLQSIAYARLLAAFLQQCFNIAPEPGSFEGFIIPAGNLRAV
jgi:hypothetical protein